MDKDQQIKEYRGWEIRVTGTTVGTKFSARIEVRKPGHGPRTHNSEVVPFRKHAASPTEAQAAALQAAEKWIDGEMD
jgi:hypothetical protein